MIYSDRVYSRMLLRGRVVAEIRLMTNVGDMEGTCPNSLLHYKREWIALPITLA